jgi:DNA-directed RNA polymerase subunit M/transcription elongation factor TFIIS
MESIDNKIRKFGVTMLNTVLSKEKNVIIVEKKIYSVLKKIHKDYLTEEIYNEFVYEVIGKIITSPLKSVLEDIKCMKVCRDDTYYDDVKYKIREQQEFLENPFEVEIGMLECNKCHCKRVFSYSRQDRSADEGFNTYCQCTNCKSKWMYKG